MKRILTIAASVAILLAGCTKNGPVSAGEVPGGDCSVGSADEIVFISLDGADVTKSDPVSLTQSFNVEASLHSPRIRYFNGKDYVYSAEGFTCAASHFWPVSGNLDFYAVSPLKYTSTSGAEMTLAVSDSSFTLSGFDGTTDIIGTRKVNVAKPDPVAPIALLFNHKLTKVTFKAVGSDPEKMYKLYSIVVKANSSAKYSFGPTESWGTSSSPNNYVFLDSQTVIPVNTQTAIPVGATRYLIPSQTSVRAKLRYSVYDNGVRTDTTLAPIDVPLSTTFWGISKSIVYRLNLVEGVLSGVFTIGAGPDGIEGTDDDVMVRFSKGNMYYDSSSGKYKFENNQYDYRHFTGKPGDAAVIDGVTTTTPAGTVGSFFWSNKSSVALAGSYSDASKTAGDVFFTNDPTNEMNPNATFTCSGSTGLWRTLTSGNNGEWNYLINRRKEALAKYGYATVSGIPGLIILPDTFIDPKTNTATGAGNGSFVPKSTTEYTANVYPSGGNWEAMEAAGAVFLPAAGYRNSSKVNSVNIFGYYSSSTAKESETNYHLFFKSSSVGPMSANGRSLSYSVRLVTVVQ